MAESAAELHAAIRAWFEAFGERVRQVDFAGGRTYFAPEVVAFGTKADIVAGLDNLEQRQWRGVWPNIADFRFVLDQLHTGGDAETAWGVVPWTSTGFHADGATFHRPGRATIVFARRHGRWLAVHSHFSLNPGTPPQTLRRDRPPG